MIAYKVQIQDDESSHLIRANVHEFHDLAIFFDSVQEIDERSDVVLERFSRLAVASSGSAVGCQMDHCVDLQMKILWVLELSFGDWIF